VVVSCDGHLRRKLTDGELERGLQEGRGAALLSGGELVVEGELCGVGFGAEVVEHALKGDAGAWCTGSVARGKRAGGSDGLAERGGGLRV
jgi:hypothetical protein